MYVSASSLNSLSHLHQSDGSEEQDYHHHTGYTDICVPTANMHEIILADFCVRCGMAIVHAESIAGQKRADQMECVWIHRKSVKSKSH